jgi:hypothetical protein
LQDDKFILAGVGLFMFSGEILGAIGQPHFYSHNNPAVPQKAAVYTTTFLVLCSYIGALYFLIVA